MNKMGTIIERECCTDFAASAASSAAVGAARLLP
jgi:hypothetical protein